MLQVEGCDQVNCAIWKRACRITVRLNKQEKSNVCEKNRRLKASDSCKNGMILD